MVRVMDYIHFANGTFIILFKKKIMILFLYFFTYNTSQMKCIHYMDESIGTHLLII